MIKRTLMAQEKNKTKQESYIKGPTQDYQMIFLQKLHRLEALLHLKY